LVSFVLGTIAWAFSFKLKRECRDRSRSVLEIYRPLALARLYGECWIFSVNFVWYSLGIACLAIFRRKYLLLISAIFSAIFCMRGNITL
jgi:hypothetical protein